MYLTINDLSAIYINAPLSRLEKALPYVNQTLEKYEINTRLRIAAYLAQLAVESGEFFYSKEIHDGSNYEGRLDLGNIFPGDGKRFRGFGDIQLTGRANNQAYGDYIGLDITGNATNREKLAEYPLRQDVAGWFWTEFKALNKYADLGELENYKIVKGVWYSAFEYLTYIINGGQNHITERKAYYKRALQVLPVGFDNVIAIKKKIPVQIAGMPTVLLGIFILLVLGRIYKNYTNG